MDETYEASYATAVLPVFAWVNSNDWMGTYLQHSNEFYSEMAEMLETPANDILVELPTLLFGRAARSCFDDFMTAEYETTPKNALDQYLEEEGMNLEEADTDFLIAFRKSIVRAYFVVSRTPDESVVLRDLFGSTREIQIEDEMLTSALAAGDNIATRILTLNGKDYLAGPVLVLDGPTLHAFKEAFEASFKEEMRKVEKYLRNDLNVRGHVRKRVLESAGPILSGMWVASLLAALGDAPPLANEDDPETLFEAIIPYDSALQPIVDALDAHPALDRPLPKEFLWFWHSDRANPEASLKAMVWISGPDIYLESCEMSRIEEAVGGLQILFGDALGEPAIHEAAPDWDEDEDEEDEEDEESMTEDAKADLIRRFDQMVEGMLRPLLDAPVPDLNNQSPRELVKTAKGRKQVRTWLTDLEAKFQGQFAAANFPDYDFCWIWKELGIAADRQPSLLE